MQDVWGKSLQWRNSAKPSAGCMSGGLPGGEHDWYGVVMQGEEVGCSGKAHPGRLPAESERQGASGKWLFASLGQ